MALTGSRENIFFEFGDPFPLPQNYSRFLNKENSPRGLLFVFVCVCVYVCAYLTDYACNRVCNNILHIKITGISQFNYSRGEI